MQPKKVDKAKLDEMAAKIDGLLEPYSDQILQATMNIVTAYRIQRGWNDGVDQFYKEQSQGPGNIMMPNRKIPGGGRPN